MEDEIGEEGLDFVRGQANGATFVFQAKGSQQIKLERSG